jgi:hypothetical protein
MGHHYVPQRYLRNFQEPNSPGMIWLHDSQSSTPRPVPIKNVFQARNYYADDTEMHLARVIETPGSAAMEKLALNQGIDREERLNVARYFDVMLKRVPAHRRWVRGLIAPSFVIVFEHAQQIIKEMEARPQPDVELIARRRREMAELEQRYTGQTPQWAIDRANDPRPSLLIVERLAAMTWRVLLSQGPQYFITSDNPAFFFRGLGLDHQEAEFSFPLSTSHALHGSWQAARSDITFVPVNQRTVREINRRTASRTVRLALYHKSAPWILPILCKPDGYLSRIRW